MCEGATVEPELYETAIENCYKEKCEGFQEELDRAIEFERCKRPESEEQNK